MNDLVAMAASMFGGAHPTAPAPARSSSQQTSDDVRAERMFGETSKLPQPSTPTRLDKRDFNSLDDDDKAARMFGNTDPALNHGNSMRAIENAAMEQFLSSPEEAKEAAEYWAGSFQSFGLNSTESAAVAEIGVAAFTNPPPAALVESWVEESRAVLVQDFGPKGAAQALADARAYVEFYATPELRDVLMSTGMGSHPQLVRLAAAKGRAMRAAGKLK